MSFNPGYPYTLWHERSGLCRLQVFDSLQHDGRRPQLLIAGDSLGADCVDPNMRGYSGHDVGNNASAKYVAGVVGRFAQHHSEAELQVAENLLEVAPPLGAALLGMELDGVAYDAYRQAVLDALEGGFPAPIIAEQ